MKMSQTVLETVFNAGSKTVLITGATGYFGRYIAQAFLGVGSNVILLGRSAALTRQVKEYCKQYGKGTAVGYRVDSYHLKRFESVLKEISKKHSIDVLINNAYDLSPRTGFNTPRGRLENAEYSQWLNAFESGIYWAVLATQVIGATMRRKRSGSIINISSMYSIVAPDPHLYEGTDKFNPPSYGAAKAGLNAFTRYVASFWGRDGIRCNAVLAGAFSNVETVSLNSVKPGDPFLKRLKNKTALGRLGHPRDLWGILLYLASDASSYTTGQLISVDGGWTSI